MRQIRDNQFQDAVKILQMQLEMQPTSLPALSLLGFCYFHLQEFEAAADW